MKSRPKCVMRPEHRVHAEGKRFLLRAAISIWRRLYANSMWRASSREPHVNTFYERRECFTYFLRAECNCGAARHCMQVRSGYYFIIHIYECEAIYFKLNVNRNACAHTKRWIRAGCSVACLSSLHPVECKQVQLNSLAARCILQSKSNRRRRRHWMPYIETHIYRNWTLP